MMKKIVFISLGLLALPSLYISYRLFIPLNQKAETLSLDIPPGQTFYQMAGRLEEQKIIRSKTDMKFLIRLYGRPKLLQGEYEMSASQPLWRIFQNLRQGKEKTFLIKFPEGLNHYEMAELLKSSNWPAADDFLKAVWNKELIRKLLKQDLNSMEGYLFPDSYNLRKYMGAETLIAMMLKRFFEVYGEMKELPLEYKFNLHQIVTMASLIEKETGSADERALISGVFYNRLKRNMRLQTDPTVLYAMYLKTGFDIEKNIRKKDLLMSSPYNSYKVYGLPPGPIANPGEKSLLAVFQPEKSDYLYFVSKNDGSHHFSKSYREHKKAVYKYQIKAFQK